MEGQNNATKLHEVSFPLPGSLETRIHLSVTASEKSVMVFVTTCASDSEATNPMGSFVYALPTVRVYMPLLILIIFTAFPKSLLTLLKSKNSSEPLSTALFTAEQTVDFATRLAKLVAKRSGRPTYVSSSLSLQSTILGGTVEEEMEAFQRVVRITLDVLNTSKSLS